MKLKDIYFKKVVPAMKEKFGYKNIFAVPRIEKVVVNVGTGKHRGDPKMLEEIQNILAIITSQKPLKTVAKKAIAAFKIREGMEIGMKVTLRGERMYSFLDRLINFSLPRTKDFHGLNDKSIDQSGNLTIGIKEHIIFPEISHENVYHIFGLEAIVVTTAETKGEGLELFRLMGFPIKK